MGASFVMFTCYTSKRSASLHLLADNHATYYHPCTLVMYPFYTTHEGTGGDETTQKKGF